MSCSSCFGVLYLLCIGLAGDHPVESPDPHRSLDVPDAGGSVMLCTLDQVPEIEVRYLGNDILAQEN